MSLIAVCSVISICIMHHIVHTCLLLIKQSVHWHFQALFSLRITCWGGKVKYFFFVIWVPFLFSRSGLHRVYINTSSVKCHSYLVVLYIKLFLSSRVPIVNIITVWRSSCFWFNAKPGILAKSSAFSLCSFFLSFLAS